MRIDISKSASYSDRGLTDKEQKAVLDILNKGKTNWARSIKSDFKGIEEDWAKHMKDMLEMVQAGGASQEDIREYMLAINFIGDQMASIGKTMQRFSANLGKAANTKL